MYKKDEQLAEILQCEVVTYRGYDILKNFHPNWEMVNSLYEVWDNDQMIMHGNDLWEILKAL